MKNKSTKKAPAAKKACCVAVKKAPVKKVALKNVTFTFHADKGKSVFVAGEFNQWNPTATKMAYKEKEGIYAATLKLDAGTYQYKFVIDGTWCADPENAEAVPNDQGTFNSLLTVK